MIADAKRRRTDRQAVSLCGACATGDIEALSRLMSVADIDLDHGDYDNRRPIHLAACMGNLKAIEMLVAARADVNVKDRMGTTPLHDALVHKKDEAARLLIAHGAQRSYDQIADRLCYVASRADGLDELRYLVTFEAFGVSATNYEARSGLHLAAAEGHVEAVRLLLESGAQVNAQDKNGVTPLQDAFHGDHGACAKLLLEHGGLMGQFDQGVQFCTAGAANDVPMLNRLIQYHCDVNQGDYDGRTGLHLACSNGHVDAVHFLTKQPNVNIHVEDRYGNSPMDDALRETVEDIQIVRTLLASRGGKPGGHVIPEASISASGAEEALIAQNAALIAHEEAHLPAITEFKAWVRAHYRFTRETRKMLVEVRGLERTEDVNISESKPLFWPTLRGYARTYQLVFATELADLEQFSEKWGGEFAGFASALTKPMQEDVSAHARPTLRAAHPARRCLRQPAAVRRLSLVFFLLRVQVMRLLHLKATGWSPLERLVEAHFSGAQASEDALATLKVPAIEVPLSRKYEALLKDSSPAPAEDAAKAPDGAAEGAASAALMETAAVAHDKQQLAEPPLFELPAMVDEAARGAKAAEAQRGPHGEEEERKGVGVADGERPEKEVRASSAAPAGATGVQPGGEAPSKPEEQGAKAALPVEGAEPSKRADAPAAEKDTVGSVAKEDEKAKQAPEVKTFTAQDLKAMYNTKSKGRPKF